MCFASLLSLFHLVRPFSGANRNVATSTVIIEQHIQLENSWMTIMKYFSIKNVISVKELVHIGGLTITER